MSSTIKVNNIQNLAGDDSGFDLSTNDKIGMKIANSEVVTVDTTGVVFNENSADRDFRVESDGNTHGLFLEGSTGNVGIGTSSTSERLHLDSGGATTTIQIDSDTESSITFNDHGGSAKQYKIGTNISDNNSQFEIRDVTAGESRIRIDTGGNLIMGQTSANSFNLTSGFGFDVRNGNGLGVAVQDNPPGIFNRTNTDGNVVLIRHNSVSEGVISVSGSTVTYGGFSGQHESSGIATSTPIGTVVSTIDELDVYAKTQDGDAHPKAGQIRADHAKVEVSDTKGDSAVYGVVSRFEEDNKVFVASVGIGSVRVTGACAKGDLLESNGDGTAKVQSDDIVRSKTIGKVTIGNSNTGVKLVSCVLYCG